jgi:hypothetical protein
MEPAKPDFLHILQTLSEHRVDYIIVGGVCAVLHGAPISTFDMDIVHSREPGNVDRLLEALEKLDARYRGRHAKVLKPDRRDLASPGHHLLITRAGPLDVLGEIGRDRDYAALLDHTVELKISKAVTALILKLETLIETKREAARDKDLAMLPILEETLKETRGR